MPRPKRHLLATAEETSNPPPALKDTQAIGRVTKGEGNNLYTVELPDGRSQLVELPSRFRSFIWIKRGGFVLIDTAAFGDRENKLDGEIVNVIRDEKYWRKQAYWYTSRPEIHCQQLIVRYRPLEFARKSTYPQDSKDEHSTVGKMPPSESDTEE